MQEPWNFPLTESTGRAIMMLSHQSWVGMYREILSNHDGISPALKVKQTSLHLTLILLDREWKMQISWSGQSGPHPMAQPTFLVKTHLVLIVWRMSYEPPCGAPLTKWGWITRKKNWFDLWCCQQGWAWRKFQREWQKLNTFPFKKWGYNSHQPAQMGRSSPHLYFAALNH